MRRFHLLVTSFVILVVVLLAYWPVAAMLDALKWDMLDCFYPWRSFVADCVQHRVFPLWNPYQHFGYPIFADMRSAFYPEPWIVGLLGGYTLQWLHGLFIFYLFMAGLGMYQLAERFGMSQTVRITIACAYVLSGFFVGHGQDMAVFVSGAWIPWSLNYFLRLQERLDWEDVWKLVFFMFLHLTGGYHALNIIYVHLLIVLGLTGLVRNLLLGNRTAAVRLIALNSIAAIVALGTISALVVAYFQASPHVGRLTGLSLKQAYVGLIKPLSISSFMAPFGVTSLDNLAETDVTMQNVYVGLTVLVLFLVGLFSKKNLSLKVLLLFGVICLLASLGPYTPMRSLLFNHIPGMNLFRMSSFFAYFAQLAILITAGVGLEKIVQKPYTSSKLLRISIGSVLLFTLVCGILAYTVWPTASVLALKNMFRLNEVQDSFSFSQRIVVHVVIQLIVLFLFSVIIALRRRSVGLFTALTAILIIVEMTISVRLNFSTTIGGEFDPIALQKKLDVLPNGFPLPDTKTAIRWYSGWKQQPSPLYQNTNILTKAITADGYNSFTLRRFDAFTDKRKDAFQNALKKPLIYGHEKGTRAELTFFDPNTFRLIAHAETNDSLTLEQTFFPGWEIWVNGSRVDFHLEHDIFPTVAIPKGDSEVLFVYKNPIVKKAWMAATGLLLVVISLIVYSHFKHTGNSYRNSIFLSIVFAAVMTTTFGLLYAKTSSSHAKKIEHYVKLCDELLPLIQNEQTVLVLQVDNEFLMDSLLIGRKVKNPRIYGWNGNGRSLKQIAELDSKRIRSVVHAGWNQLADNGIRSLLADAWPRVISQVSENGFIEKHVSGKPTKPVLDHFNDFETENPNWNFRESNTIPSLVYDGQHAWTISGSSPGSPPLRIKVGTAASFKECWFVFQMQCRISSENVGMTNAYIVVERDGEKIWEDALGLNLLANGSFDWFPAIQIVQPNITLEENDDLTVFIWGGEGDPVYLDNMSFRIYPSEYITASFSE